MAIFETITVYLEWGVLDVLSRSGTDPREETIVTERILPTLEHEIIPMVED